MNLDITYCINGGLLICEKCQRNIKLYTKEYILEQVTWMMRSPGIYPCPYFMEKEESSWNKDYYEREANRVDLGDPIEATTLCPMCGKSHKIFSRKCGDKIFNFYRCNNNTYLYGIDGHIILNKENV